MNRLYAAEPFRNARYILEHKYYTGGHKDESIKSDLKQYFQSLLKSTKARFRHKTAFKKYVLLVLYVSVVVI